MVSDPLRVIAHRGASGYAPENTMAAFKNCSGEPVGSSGITVFEELVNGDTPGPGNSQ